MGILLSICPCDKLKNNRENIDRQIESNLIPQPSSMSHMTLKEADENNNNFIFIDAHDSQIEVKYKIKRKLSEGLFGSTHLAVYKQTGENRTVQIYLKKQGFDPPKIKHLITAEFELLKSLNHPNILKAYELYETSTELMIVNDYSEGEELFETIYKNKVINEEMAAIIMYQLFNAVAYFHLKGIIHRDLRSDIISLETNTLSGNVNIKILDVGFAMMTEKGKFGNKVNAASFYIAPEVIDKQYNYSCDLWSCGVILYSMLSGRLPFNANNNKELFAKIKLGQYDIVKPPFDKISPEAIDLINSLLRLQAHKRIFACNAHYHPWFKKFQVHKRMGSFNFNSINYLFSQVTMNLQLKQLKRSTMAFLIRYLYNMEAVVEARRFFYQLDIKQRGVLTQEEFDSGLKLLSQDNSFNSIQSYSDNLFASIDTFNKGAITLEQFLIMAINPKKVIKEVYLREVFNALIKDKNDKVVIEYLRSIISKGQSDFPSLEFTSIAAKVDSKKSGRLTFDGFVLLIVQIINQYCSILL